VVGSPRGLAEAPVGELFLNLSYVFVVVVVLVAFSILAAKVLSRIRKGVWPGRAPLPPLCPHCGGTRRLVLPNGEEWPCPDNAYRHADDPPQST
jgi:hypothetical protein